MKLIYCKHCGDFVLMRVGAIKACECGLSRGQYQENKETIEIMGPCMALGIGNGMMRLMLKEPGAFPAWFYGDLVPHNGTVVRLDDEIYTFHGVLKLQETRAE